MLDIKIINEIMEEGFENVHTKVLKQSQASYDAWCKKAEEEHDEKINLNKKFYENCWKADGNF